MNLCAMTLDDLRALQAQMDLIAKALTILSGQPCNQDDVLLCVDLTPGEVPIITTHWRMPGAHRHDAPPEVVIEEAPAPQPAGPAQDDYPAADEVDRSLFVHRLWRIERLEQRHRDADREALIAAKSATLMAGADRQAEPHAPEPEQARAPVSASAPAPAASGPVLGPLTEAERATILRMDAGGASRRAIADHLGRRVQTVALFLDRPAPKPLAVAQPAETAEQDQRPRPAADDMAAAVQPEAATAAPVDDATGGAVIAPDPAAGAGCRGPLPPPDRGADIEIWAHLRALGYAAPFDAGIDLQICEDLARGVKADMIAADLGLDSKQVVARFRALSAPIRDDRDRVSPDGQARLAAELRRRAAWAAQGV